MSRAPMAALAAGCRYAPAYVGPALLLAWFAGGQMALGRIDAALAIPWLMPGALLLAWRVRDADRAVRRAAFAAALLATMIAQWLLHAALGGRPGVVSALAVLGAGLVCSPLAIVIVGRTRRWLLLLRWPAVLLAAGLWFVAGQAGLGYGYAPRAEPVRPKLAILTGLPLRWTGGGDVAAMLAAGPRDAPALAELERRFDVRLIDSVAEAGDADALLVAHPRALAPAELVRLDRRRGDLVLLVDALSTWPPPHPLGDPRNPPVTSLMTPLLDHWGITLAAPPAGGAEAGAVDVSVEPAGQRLRLHSAGRFTRLPPGCRSYGDRRVARCPIGGRAVWLVGDADLLHDSLWRPPLAGAPWLRRSDNLPWLAGVLGAAPSPALLAPIWIR